MSHAKDYGLSAGEFGFDIEAIVKRSRGIAVQMNNGVQFLMKKNKVDIIWGEAVLTAPGEIKVAPTKKTIVQPQGPIPKNALGEGTYKAKNIIIATGARPRVLPGIEPDGDKIWTYFEAMKPDSFPKSLVVMGSGAIGTEFASFYRSLGAEVTVIELLPQILPVEDAEIAAHVKKNLAGHAAPREIEFRDKLPKTRSGKIMRRVLKAWDQGLPVGDLSTLED